MISLFTIRICAASSSDQLWSRSPPFSRGVWMSEYIEGVPGQSQKNPP